MHVKPWLHIIEYLWANAASWIYLFIYFWVLIFKIREWTAVIWVGATSFGVVKRGTISYAVCKSSAFQNLDPLAVRSLLTPIVLLVSHFQISTPLQCHVVTHMPMPPLHLNHQLSHPLNTHLKKKIKIKIKSDYDLK